MATVTIRPYTPADIPAIVTIGNRINWDAPPLTVAKAEHFYAVRSKRGGIEQWVAEMEGTVVGSAMFWGLWEVEPKGAWMMFLEVDDPYRSHGIGTLLYARVVERVPPMGVRRILVPIREDRPDGLAFAEHRGFTRTGQVDHFMRLDVDTVRLDDFKESERRLERGGIRIASIAELGPEDELLLRAIHALNERTGKDIPMTITLIDRPYEEWLGRVRDSPTASFTTFWVALDGDRPVGLTRLNLESDGYARNAFTGVDREYRSRGIALALKLQTVRWARENGIRAIFTDNAAENHAMLAINRRLGYTQLPGTIEYAHEY